MASRAEAPHDLVLGLLALENGLIDQAQLLAGFKTWTHVRNRPLVEVLIEQGALELRDRSRIERLVQEHLEGCEDCPETHDSSGVADIPGKMASPADDLSRTRTYLGVDSTEEGRDSSPGPGTSAVSAQQRYRILRRHAQGGLGEVFLALDPELNRQVALKELQAFHAHDPSSQSRFQIEAEVTGRLEHPGIVPVYALGRHADGRPYYVMRFIEGETLKAAIERYHASEARNRQAGARDRSFRRLLRSLIDACNAVAYAHSRGVLHRDLKPENIMLGPFGETLVVDWGIAKPGVDSGGSGSVENPSLAAFGEDASLTRPGSAIGTPRYMSPEQAAGDLARIGPASDVYGLGATLYCLLVGHSPFPQGSLSDVLRGVSRGIFPAPRRVRRSVDPVLEAICLKAMALKPEDRHASPLTLAEEIEAWLADVRYRNEQEHALNQVKRSLVRLCIERALNFFGREMHSEGMLWLARSLENVPSDFPVLERVIRTTLGGWHARTKLLERSLAHGGGVHAVSFSPDGRRLATACEDGEARLWDVATGSKLTRPLAHDGPVRAVAFDPTGRVVATGSDDGTIRFWDALTGTSIQSPIVQEFPVADVRFSPDGRLIAVVGWTGLPSLWEFATGRPINQTVAGGRIMAIAFSPDGSLLTASTEDSRVWSWETDTGRLRGEPLSHEVAVSALCFSPDGRSLLAGCHDGKARLWDLGRRSPTLEVSHRGKINSVAFSFGGAAVFATASDDGTARLWDPATSHPIGESLEHEAAVVCLAFSPDGTILATGSLDRTARLWDSATGLPIGPPFEHRGAVHALCFTSDGRRLATASADAQARCWKVPTPIPGDVERITCWVSVSTELEFDAGDAIRRIDPTRSWELRRHLYELGGPPIR